MDGLPRNEENSAFLDKIITLCANGTEIEVMDSLHYDFLMSHTNNGKLYKYRCFDKNDYSITNFKTGTLHCSKSSDFNDPFDFRIGVTVESVLKSKQETELHFVTSVFDKFYKYSRGEINKSDCTNEEWEIINTFMNTPKIAEFFNESNLRSLDYESEDAFLSTLFDVINQILEVLCLNDSLKETLSLTRQHLPQISEKLRKQGIDFLESHSFSLRDFAYINGIEADVDEIQLVATIAQILFPGSYHKTSKSLEKLIKYEEQLNNYLDLPILIGSVSDCPKNRLMWAHYAEKHTGFCVEYDFKNANKMYWPFPIVYSKSRPQMNWDFAFDKRKEATDKAKAALMKAMLTKDRLWEYEHEWRVLISSSESPDIEVPISAVYLGACINRFKKAEIIDAANDRNITVFQMVMDRGTYDLHVEQI